MRRLFIFGMLIMLLMPPAVWACGGFFSPDDSMNQTAEHMIFTVNGDGTITAIVGIEYQGEASEFSWLLPVPSVPEIEVAERATLTEILEATNVSFIRPENYCNALHLYGGFGGGGGEPIVGTVGPYEYVILGGEDVLDVTSWLRDNGYRVDEKAEPIINEYVEMGMYFVAMRLRPEAAVGDIQPVKLTFEAEQPMIPIKLASVASAEVVPIYVWIFADTQYAPQNYVSLRANYSNQTGFETFGYPSPPDRPLIQYAEEREQLVSEHNGHAFITEYAQPAAQLPPPSDPLLAELVGRFPYVTRLWTQLTPEQMTLDPVFAPALDAPDVSNTVHIDEYIEPLMYWGCTTRAALNHWRLEDVSDGRTRIDEWQLEVAHPENWVVSNFTFNNQTVWAFAPEKVDETNFLNGDIPVLFVTPFANGVPPNIFEPLKNLTPSEYFHVKFHVRDRLYEGYGGPTGYLVAVAANADLWREHGSMFAAMNWYGAFTYQHYRHPDLQHTLFLTADYEAMDINALDTHVEVPYPAGWIEKVDENGIVTLFPENQPDGAAVRLLPLPSSTDPQEENLNWLESMYDLPADTAWEAFSEMGCGRHTTKPVYFEKDGRAGYVRLTSLYGMEVSAPIDEFAENNALLQEIINSTLSEISCG